MTSIAFIMPSYNRAEYISESIATITAQMRPQDTLTIVDDGSTDNTEQVVRGLGLNLTFLRQENAGKSVALNRALAATQSDYVWICDDDDLLRPNIVGRFVEKIEADDVDVVFGRYTRFRLKDGVRIEMGTGYWPDLSVGTINRHVLEDAFIMHNATLVRRDAYEAAGYFDPAMLRSQDYGMFVKLALTCRFAYIDEVVFDQRKHEGRRGPKNIQHAANSSDTVWQKFDKMIFDGFREQVPLAFFEACFNSDSAKDRTRCALLQRACIFGRHGLWQKAIDDCEKAVALESATYLSAIEADICRRMMSGKHGFSGALEPQIMSRIITIESISEFGRNLVMELANGVIWRLRAEDQAAKIDAMRFLKQLGAFRISLSLAKRRLLPKYTKATVEERNDFRDPCVSLV